MTSSAKHYCCLIRPEHRTEDVRDNESSDNPILLIDRLYVTYIINASALRYIYN